MHGVRRADKNAQGAVDTILGTGQPRQGASHFQAAGRTNPDTVAAARAACFV